MRFCRNLVGCWEVAGLRKRGELSWEMLAVFLLALAILVVMLVFSTFMREKIIEAFHVFVETIFGD